MDNRLGGAVRAGNHKMIRNYDDGSMELYNLESALSETKHLAKRHPNLASRLDRKLGRWLTDTGAWMPKPPKPRGR